MPKIFNKQVFQTTYKDDHADSDGYHRILFNSGRALQARELTQLQTIIQKEITRLGQNVFRDGAPVNNAGSAFERNLEFVKIKATTPLPSNVSIIGNVFVGQTSNIKIRVEDVLAATDTDPETLYVTYLDTPEASSGQTAPRVTPDETLSGTIDGNTYTFDVQQENTALNPATGRGIAYATGEGSFFAVGRFVFSPKQRIYLSKYTQNYTGQIVFKVTEDIVTSSDNAALFDNQGATPNRSSPGADRYRIRLTLSKLEDLDAEDNHVPYADIADSKEVSKVSASEGYNEIREHVATRVREIHGNFIKKYFKAKFIPNNDTTFKLVVDPGLAYIDGYRVEKLKSTPIVVKRSQETTTVDNQGILANYGNYFLVSDALGAKGMLNFDDCQQVNLYDGVGATGNVIGTTNVRALTEFQNSQYRLHVFNSVITDNTKSLRNVRSVGTGTSSYYNIDFSDNTTLRETKQKTLLFDSPVPRPKSFSSISLSVQRRFSGTTTGSGELTIALTTTGENFENVNDWVFASASDGFLAGSVSLTGGGTSATISGLPNSAAVEILAYVKKGQSKIRPKTLTETTVTGRIDSDGDGVKYLSLGESDIFSLNRVRLNDSDGTNIFTNFTLDTGHRDTHYDDGKLLWKGTGPITTDSAGGNGTTIFARFKYFSHGTGDFFAVNSYTGQVDYVDIPAHRMNNRRLVSLRDVLDFRPSTDGAGTFVTVNELPQPTDTVEMDAEFYLPRKDKLVLSKMGELRYLQGTPSLDPQFSETPTDCIDLYKFEMNPFTLHTKDLKSRILPLKGYTMADINKLETKLDKVEEMAVLSMLELKTQALKALDSAGADRTKSGFFVDNFANHSFTDTQSPEHRATIDPQKKFMRPGKKESVIDLRFDSANSNQLRVKKSGDLITLDYTEADFYEQGVASRVENLNPFFVEKLVGSITMSPASDYWKEIDIQPPQIIDQPSVLDTSNAVNWNNHEWDWGGVPLDDLQVGASQGQVTGTSTSRTSNTLEPFVSGTSTSQQQGDWVVTGSTSNTTSLGTQTNVVSQSTEEVSTDWGLGGETGTAAIVGVGQDLWVANNDGRAFAGQAGGITIQTGQVDTIQTTTSETREALETVDTTTLEQTTTTTTETEFTTETQITTNVSTTTTVNRISGEHTVREVVGQRVFDLISIPWMRSRKVSFRGDGLRPNTRYFPFFDDTDVGTFCIATSNFVRHSDRNPETRTANLTPSVTHSEQNAGNELLISDASGTVNGEFEIPNNSAMRFATGTREFALYDVSVPDTDAALSFAKTNFTSTGDIEPVQDIIHSTRVLEVTGSTSTSVSNNTESVFSTSTDVAIVESTAQDVQTSSTQTEVVLGQETNSEVIDSQAINVTIFLPRDPLAQTFFVDVDAPNGAFLTKVRVYFATKDDEGLPVEMQIRPVINGVPASSEIVPGSRKFLQASEVTAITDTYTDPTIDEMLANGTDFEFDEPIYLKPLTEYAIVLMTPSMKYRTYISRVEDFVLGSTERRISEQPSLASLFKSQNSFLWEPSQTEDLAYKLFRADFQTSGNVFLENVNQDPVVLAKSPFVVRQENIDSGDPATITVIHRGHGLRQGDLTTITGLDSDTRYNGVLGSSIIGQRQVTSVDGTGYEFLADSDFTIAARFGNGKCSGSFQPTFDLVWPSIQTMKVPTTDITFSAKFTSNSSLVDSSSGRFVQDSQFTLIKNKSNNYFNAPRCIINPNEEATELSTYSYPKSAIVQLNLTTTDSKVSPVIDMQRAGLTMIGNMIDKQDSASTDGFNVPLSYVPESHPFLGSSLSKHLTKPVTLEEVATGLKVILAANKPPEASFQLWYRTGEAEDELSRKNWVLASADNVLPSDTNKTIFREYRYTIGGFGDVNNLNGGDMSDFRQFQLKIVMNSTNSAKVPVIRDLRAIALAV